MIVEKKLQRLRWLTYHAWQVAFVMSTIVFFYIVPRLDVLLFPVVSDFQITEIRHFPDHVEVSGVLTKDRGECKPIEITIFSHGSPNGMPEKGYRFVSTTKDEYNSRPEGSQKWGPWAIYPPDPPLGPSIQFEVVHQCNSFWTVRTVLTTVVTKDLFPNAQIMESPL